MFENGILFFSGKYLMNIFIDLIEIILNMELKNKSEKMMLVVFGWF